MTTILNKLFTMLFYGSPEPFKKLMMYLPVEIKLGGKLFRETYAFIKSTEFLPREKLVKIQEKMLKKTLMNAVSKVPFYKRLGIKISSADDAFKIIRKFPLIDKDFLKENMKLFLSGDINSLNTYYTSTGGTSGRQFTFYIDKEAYIKEWAFMISLWERAGYKPGDKVVTFRGVKIKGVSKGIYWQEQPLYNALEMSPFHLNYETAPLYIRKIIEWKPKFLHGYPSAITLLAKFVKEYNLEEKIPPVKAVLLTSENIYSWQRELISKVFRTRVFSWYGQTEKVALAGECGYSSLYHVFPQYSYVEVVDKNGEPVDEGEEGEIVGTGFLNRAMPFIRYKTGDYAKLAENVGCVCGRDYMLLEYVKGRHDFEYFVVGKRESLISVAALNIHTDAFESCERFQLYQDTPGKLVIKVVPIPGKFTDKDIKKIEKAFKDRIGDELYIEIDLREDIHIAPSGKIPLLVQKLNINKYVKEIRSGL